MVYFLQIDDLLEKLNLDSTDFRIICKIKTIILQCRNSTRKLTNKTYKHTLTLK